MKKICLALLLFMIIGCNGNIQNVGSTSAGYPTLREKHIVFDEIDKELVKEIYIVDSLSDDTKDKANFAWDCSEKQNRSIIAYFIEESGKLVVCGNGSGRIYANPDSRFAFCGFCNCKSIIGLEKIDTTKVTTMASMFEHTTFGDELSIDNWNTSNVICMSHMFENSYSYYGITPNVSNWNTSKLTDVEEMFKNYNTINDFKHNLLYTALREHSLGNVQLNFPDFSNWDISHITEAKGMFDNYGNNRISYTDKNLRDENWSIKGLPNFLTNFINGYFSLKYMENIDMKYIINDYYPCVEDKEVFTFDDSIIKTTFLKKIGNYNKEKIEFN